MAENKKKAECETCPIEETYAAMPVEDKLYLNWQTASQSIRQRIARGNAERRILRTLEKCGRLEREELLRYAATKTGDSAEALKRLMAEGLVSEGTEIELTAAGVLAAAQAREQQTEERRGYFADLNGEEKEQLLSILEKLNNGRLGK